MRVALHSTIVEGSIDEYRAQHATIPADLRALFGEAGIRDWTIWRSGRHLFHLVECDDFAHAMSVVEPHPANIAWQQDIGRFVAGRLRDYAAAGSTSLSVNLPQVTPDAASTHRLAHLHHNVPGVLAKIGRVLADHGVNVVGQHLSTQGDLGYVLTDTPQQVDDEVATALAAMEETVRLRVLG